MAFWWNGQGHSDELNLRWTWLRANEWTAWPLFIAQPIAPLLLLLKPELSTVWWIALSVIALSQIWKLFRYRFISLRLADAGSWFVHTKWLASLAAAIGLIEIHQYEVAATAGLWPLVTLALVPFYGGGMVGVIQKVFLLKLGYLPTNGDWENCPIDQFYRSAIWAVDSSGTDVDQSFIDRSLRWGIVFSLFWLMGIGSAIAVINGFKARRLIKQNPHNLRGMGRAWWCLVVGGLGISIWLPVISIGVFNTINSQPAPGIQPAKGPTLRHASNGWYLIIPPLTELSSNQIKAFPEAQFSTWHTMAAFGSVSECEQTREQYRSVQTAALRINPDAYHLGSRPNNLLKAQEWDARLAALKSALGESVHDASCIASDDPRLKPN